MTVDVDNRDGLNDGLTSVQGKPYGSNGPEVQCPSCSSKRLFKDGWRKLSDGSKAQRYLCRDCGYRFTDPSHRNGKIHEASYLNSSSNTIGIEDEDLSRAGFRSETGVVTLMEKSLSEEKGPAGGASASEQSENLLTGFALWLLKNGRKGSTVDKNVRIIKMLRKITNIYDPEAVKESITKMGISDGTKDIYVNAYDNFLKFIGGSWDKPKFKLVEKVPFIPSEEELNILIAGSGKKVAALLQLLKETGARIGEALMLKWTDVDFERRVVNITPEKGSKPRILPISEKLIAMLKSLPKNGERVFPGTRSTVEVNFSTQRNALAEKLKNPRLKKITFHTFRHWKATMEYHKTKDIVYVKELLGHKSIQNTMIYINIERALFQTPKDEFYCKTASTIDEASKLIEAGFEYVTTFNGIMLFRKRK